MFYVCEVKNTTFLKLLYFFISYHLVTSFFEETPWDVIFFVAVSISILLLLAIYFRVYFLKALLLIWSGLLTFSSLGSVVKWYYGYKAEIYPELGINFFYSVFILICALAIFASTVKFVDKKSE